MSSKTHAKMGLLPLIAMVMSNILGTGIFFLPTVLASIGSISIFGWLASSLGALALGFIFSRLHLILPKAGGLYEYSKQGFGDYLGFQTAYIYWLAAWIGNIATALTCVSYLVHFFPFFKDPVSGCLGAIVLLWIFTCMNALGVRFTGSFQIFTIIAVLLSLLSVLLISWHAFSFSVFIVNYQVSGKTNFAAISSAAAFTLWAFIGIESACVSSGLIKDPSINVPLSTLIATLLTALIYTLSSAIIMGVIPSTQLMHTSSAFSLIATQAWGSTGGNMMTACIVLACFGSLCGWTLLTGQIAKAAADDELFPKFFSRLNKKHIPLPGLLIVAVIMSIVLLATISPSLSHQFKKLVTLTVFLILFCYLYAAVAIIKFKLTDKILSQKIKWDDILVAVFAILYTLLALRGCDRMTVLIGGLILLTSLPFYKGLMPTFKRKGLE